MPLPEPWPLEAVFSVIVLWSGLIGLFLLAVQTMTGVPRVYPLAGFFYMLTRAGLAVLVAMFLRRQLAVLQAPSGWGEFVLRLFVVLMFALIVLENLVILANRVITDRYGSGSRDGAIVKRGTT